MDCPLVTKTSRTFIQQVYNGYSPYRKMSPTSSNGLSAGDEDIQDVIHQDYNGYSPYRKMSPTSSNGLSAGDEDIQDVHTPGLTVLLHQLL
jgi:hypothetical protein